MIFSASRSGEFLAPERDAEIDRDPFPVFGTAEPVDGQVHADLAAPPKRRENELVTSIGHQGCRFAIASGIIAGLRMK
jgi:hypothetical protein